MDAPIRNRSYVSISLGVVNQSAQGSAKTSSSRAYFSDVNIFDKENETIDYATLEENYTKANGKFLFPPRQDASAPYKQNGFVSSSIKGGIKINFDQMYSLKGMTIVFGECFPTRFKIVADDAERTYENDVTNFTCEDRFDDTTSIEIIPLEMVGGQQRLHIKYILMGVGLSFTNESVKDIQQTSYVSGISSEVSYNEFSTTVFDTEGRFDVDNDDSFMNYLEPMQDIYVSFGIDLGDGNQEWLQTGKHYLKSWANKNGQLTLTATDKLSQNEAKYTLGNVLKERSVYSELISVFTDMGLEPEDYSVDYVLQNIKITNPLPETTHRECIQLLCNYARCVFFENADGQLIVKTNYESIVDEDSISITAPKDSLTPWSNINNLIKGVDEEYGDLTYNSFSLDGKRRFIPRNNEYLETAFSSADIADANGEFSSSPWFAYIFPEPCTYYSLEVDFGGEVPEQIYVCCYDNQGNMFKDVYFDNLERNNIFMEEFHGVKRIVLYVTKAKPHTRVVINKVSFGNVQDFKLTQDNMYEKPTGYKQQRVKGIRVKIYKFELDDDGVPQEVDDNVYYTYGIDTIGNYVTVENQLVNTESQARLLAQWIGNYYSNDVTYSTSYRGEPRLQPNDIIYLYSPYKNNLQVAIEKASLSYNGAISGDLELRRAIRLKE